MRDPTTAWDRNPTDKELENFYGKDKPHRVHDEIMETLTETILTTSHKRLCVPYIKCSSHVGGPGKLAAYPLTEVVTDYGTDKGPLQALMEVLEASTCPLVAEYRTALAKRYSDSWADDVEAFIGDES